MQEQPYSSQYDPQTGTLVVSGAVDELSESAFRGDLAAAGAEPEPGLAVIDLSAVHYFPSIAVSALVATLKDQQARGTAMADVVAVEGCVAERVLQLCGIPHRAR